MNKDTMQFDVDVASPREAVQIAATMNRSVTLEEALQSDLAPLDHWLHFTPTAPTDALGADGHPGHSVFIPDPNLPRRMWAGSSIEYHSPISIGSAIRRVTSVDSVTNKEGSSGRLCFVVLRHEISARGEVALVERQTLVYREAVDVAGSAAQEPRPDAPLHTTPPWYRTFRPDERTLFRYSAMTFNTHRIHYDQAYATQVEGYPGLVVHGPLLATYIMDSFLDEHPGAVVLSFSFSARAPLFVNEQFHVVGGDSSGFGDRGGSLQEVQIIGPDGKPATTATIEYIHADSARSGGNE